MSEYNDSIFAEVLGNVSRPNSQRTLGAVTSVVLAVCLAGFSVLMPFMISSFESIFADFGVELPWLTQTLLGIPDIAWIAFAVVGFVVIVAKDRVVSFGAAKVLNVVILLVGAIVAATAFVALSAPLFDITRSIK